MSACGCSWLSTLWFIPNWVVVSNIWDIYVTFPIFSNYIYEGTRNVNFLRTFITVPFLALHLKMMWTNWKNCAININRTCVRAQKGVVNMNSIKKDECEMIADEIMNKLHKISNQKKISIESLLSIGVDIFTDTIKNSW